MSHCLSLLELSFSLKCTYLFMYLFGKSGSEWWLSNINEMHSPDALVLFKCYVFPVSCPLLCSHCAFEKHYYFAVNSEDSIFVIFIIIAFVSCLLCALLKLWYEFKSHMCKAASCSGMNKKIYKMNTLPCGFILMGFILQNHVVLLNHILYSPFTINQYTVSLLLCTPCD